MSVWTRFYCLTFKIFRLSIFLGAFWPLMFSPTVRPQAPTLSNFSLSFEPNRGQADHDSLFVAHTPEGEVSLRKDGFGLSFAHDGKTGHLLAKFVGMNPTSAATGEDAGKGVANYYRGKDPSGWVTNVPLYNKVRYSNAYPFTDLVYHASRGRLEYDMELQPGANTDNISIEFTGAQGIRLDRDGSLVVQADGKEIRMLSPVSYQTENGKRIEVISRYTLLSANHVGISLGQYNRNERLVIDPVVAYASFLNTGSTIAPAYSNIAVDSEGNAYLGVRTYPQGGGTSEQLLIKVDSTGAVVFQNVIAGAFTDIVTTDPKGNVYMAGGALQGFTSTVDLLPPCSQVADCGPSFIAKFSSNGTMVYSTLVSVGGLASIVANANGNVYFAGGGGQIQPVNAFQSGSESAIESNFVGEGSAYFGELSADGTAFVFASYLGAGTLGSAIALDQAGDVYVAGTLDAASYTPGDPQETPAVPLKGEFEAFPSALTTSSSQGSFLCKFSPDGQTLLFGTALDGTVNGMAVGPDNSVYLAGYYSYSTPFTLSVYSLPVPSNSGGVFAMAINPSLNGLTYSTFINGSIFTAIALDGQGDLYLAGTSTGVIQSNADAIELSALAAGGATTNLAQDQSYEGFYLELDPKGNLVSSSDYGGVSTLELPQAIAVDGEGDVYLAGALSIPETGGNNVCQDPDPVTVGNVGFGQETQFTDCYSTSPGQDAGGFITKILPANQPQISLTPWLPALELRNVGSADLHISSIAPSGGLGKVWGNCGNMVATGTACSLTLTDSNGNIANGSVTITSDAEPNVQTFTPIAVANVGGVGGVIPWVDASKLSFGPQQTGVPSAPQPITIVNAGTLDLVDPTVIAEAPFTATNNCPGLLHPGDSCTGQIVWTPGSFVSVTASILVEFADAPTESFTPSVSPTSPNALATIPADGNSLIFPTENIGDTALYRTVTAMNVGAGSMAAPTATLSGDSEFTIVGNTCTTSLAPQQTCGVAVLFTPTAVGTPQATLTISGGSTTATIPLSGTGQNPVALGTVTVTPALNFGTQPIGPTTTQSAVITNTGNIALSVSYDISAYSSYPDSYSVPSGLCATIAPGTSCSIPVSFTPTGGGPQAATLSISDNAVNFAQSVSLTGVGQAPAVTLSSTQISFPNQDEGTTSAGLPITLTNSGSTALAISSIAASAVQLPESKDFSETNNCGASVAVGASCTITVYFSPSVTQEEVGELLITDNAPNSPQGVSLMGTGTVPSVTLGVASGGTNNIAVSAGQAATYSLSATASAGFSGQVALSCSNAPLYATCTVSPSVITLTGGGSAPFSVNVTTETTTTASLSTASDVDKAGFGFLGLSTLPLLLVARRRMSRMKVVLLVLFMGVIFTSFSGCGGGGGGTGTKTTIETTPPGGYSLTVTATGNFTTVTETLSLSVN
jgi:hypothetical protein